MKERDTQKRKLYTWETSQPWWEESKAHPLTLDECRALVQKYTPTTGVEDGRGRRRGCANRFRVKLPKFARHPAYVLHEVAHSLTPWGSSYNHDAPFVGRYCALLVAEGLVDEELCWHSAVKAGLQIKLSVPLRRARLAAGPKR